MQRAIRAARGVLWCAMLAQIAAAPADAPWPGGPPPEAKPPPIPAAHTEAMLAHYPPAARAAGLEGEAQLTCPRMVHGAPDGCTIASEKPYGHGFGAAALALARLAPQTLAAPSQAEKPPWAIDFKFKLEPPAITPDVLAPLHVPPRFDKGPTSDQMLEVYPTAALSSRTEGFVILFCVVGLGGGMTACTAHANPSREGFERAAMKLIPDFKLQTHTDDGSPTAGTTITIPLAFVLP
jgi:outer membrane biosynthesis protein TonB